MSLEERVRESMLGLLQRSGLPAVEVTSFEEDKRNDGYCETCYYEYTVVEIYYRDEDNKSKMYVYSGNFADLIRELT